MDRAGTIAHSILLGLTLCHVNYMKVFALLENIEGFLHKRGYTRKDGKLYGRFTPSEVKFLKKLYERRA